MTTALLVIDVQVGFIDNEFSVHDSDRMLDRVKTLIERARSKSVPVIYVRHDEAPEVDGPIHPAIAPQPNDVVISKMTPDSFYQTTLQAELDQHGVKHLIIAGFQTEMCINTTTRQAWSRGYKVTLVKDAHSTFSFPDSPLTAPQIIAHHNSALQAFAAISPVAEVLCD